MTVLDTIRKVQSRDEPTARLLLEMALFDAVCEEAERVRPQLEQQVRKAAGLRAAQGLRHLARQPVSKANAEAAEHLIRLMEFSKADGQDDLQTPYWDARGEDGRFVSGKHRRGIFNVLGFATGRPDEQMQGRVRQTMNGLVSPEDGNYGRLRTLGQGLVASNDPSLRPAGTVARLVGDIGPEAQKALEPGIRRSAYRYRGTERRPNAKLQAQVAAGVAGMQGPGQDQERLRFTSQVGVANLIDQIPDRDTASISLAAGKMPPSVGLMFDGQGRLVSEAMGFNGDHYLPFDLSNLKRLKGGSYTRTRTTGGHTDEDIYTGLLTGARHLTVVSNSGVFTLEFDPDLRGGRRYSDKAKQMVDRYGRLVAAIDSGELYQRKLPPAQVKQLRQEALAAAGRNAEQAEVLFRQREKQALAAAAFESPDDDELLDQAEAWVKENPSRGTFASQVKDRFHQLRAEVEASTARKYRLDGEGYKAALKALKTEFPYFIRSATFTPLQEYMESRSLAKPGAPRRPRGGADLGYTPPRGLDPKNAGVPTEVKGQRRILGAPTREVRGGAPAAPAGTPPAGSTPGAPGVAAPRTLESLAKAGAEQRVPAVNDALQRTLKDRVALAGEGVIPWVDPTYLDGKLVSENAQLTSGNGEAYVQWLAETYEGDWSKISKHVAESSDKRAIPALLNGLETVPAKLKDVGRSVDEKAYADAKKVLTELQILKYPFAPGNDLLAVPEPGQTNPQGLKEITDLPLTPKAIEAYAAQHPEAMKKATEWAKAEATPEQIRGEIAKQAELVQNLVKFAETGERPLGLPASPTLDQVAEDIRSVRQAGGEHQLVQQTGDLHRAWSLLRLQEVMKLTGADRDPGAAAPFVTAAKAASTSSRLVWHDRDSPVAKAVQHALVRKSRAQSLNSVRRRMSA